MKLATIAPEFPPLLRRVALILPAMMAGSLVFTVLMRRLLHRPNPFGVVWISGEQQWCDFRVFQERSLQFRTAAYWLEYDYPMTYPAAVAVVLTMFYKLPHPLRIYLAILFAGCISWAMWFAHGLVQRGVPVAQAGAVGLVILLTTWPVLYEFDTANMEGMMAIILFVGVLAVLRGGTGAWSWTGASLIAVAGAMKMFPAILFALLLSKRRYKECAFGVALMGLLNYGSLAIVGPIECWRKGNKVAGLETCFVCLCVTLGFSTFFTIFYGFENVFRCQALCVLMVTALRYSFYWPQLDEEGKIGQQLAAARQEG